MRKEKEHKALMVKIEAYVTELKEEMIVLRGEKNQIIEKCSQLK